MREQFRDNKGSSELGMLASPTTEELRQLHRAVAIMTAREKANADNLTDEQIHKIATDAKIEQGLLAIFLNGFALYRKKDR